MHGTKKSLSHRLPRNWKSTVGRRLAERLQTQCIDLDDVVEAVAGKSIREIFEQGGGVVRDFE